MAIGALLPAIFCTLTITAMGAGMLQTSALNTVVDASVLQTNTLTITAGDASMFQARVRAPSMVRDAAADAAGAPAYTTIKVGGYPSDTNCTGKFDDFEGPSAASADACAAKAKAEGAVVFSVFAHSRNPLCYVYPDLTAACPADGWTLESTDTTYMLVPDPTPAPATPAPKPAPTSTPLQVSGTGDPHLVNMHGQRFDIFQPGVHTLLHIPRWAGPRQTRLHVQAGAKRLGGACADIYFTTMNITGDWVPVVGGLHFSVESEARPQHGWQRFGPLSLKIVQGHTSERVEYLNIFAKSLNKIAFSIGGLLGADDHTAAATPDANCRQTQAI